MRKEIKIESYFLILSSKEFILKKEVKFMTYNFKVFDIDSKLIAEEDVKVEEFMSVFGTLTPDKNDVEEARLQLMRYYDAFDVVVKEEI